MEEKASGVTMDAKFWQWIALFAIFIACFACAFACITLAGLRQRSRQEAMVDPMTPVAPTPKYPEPTTASMPPPPPPPPPGALNHFEPNEPSIGHLEPWYAVIGRPDQPHALYTASFNQGPPPPLPPLAPLPQPVLPHEPVLTYSDRIVQDKPSPRSPRRFSTLGGGALPKLAPDPDKLPSPRPPSPRRHSLLGEGENTSPRQQVVPESEWALSPSRVGMDVHSPAGLQLQRLEPQPAAHRPPPQLPPLPQDRPLPALVHPGAQPAQWPPRQSVGPMSPSSPALLSTGMSVL